MDENVMLRCKYCGAPFEPSTLESDTPYVTCTSCGTSQQRVDARAYLEQMMGVVQSWISSAIPVGFNMSQAGNVDAVARHNIFIRNVQPKIESGLMEYKFANTNLMANSLLALPFANTRIPIPPKTSSQAFEFNASVKSVGTLAVDDASVKLVEEASMVSQTYALTINNAKLLAEDKEGRYLLLANNFAEAATVFEKNKKYEALAGRFKGLANVSNGIALMMEGNTAQAGGPVKDGIALLEDAKAKIMVSPELGIMAQAIEQELSVAKTIEGLVDMVQMNPAIDALKTLDVIKHVVQRGLVNSGMWSNILGSSYRYTEIFDEIGKVFKSKNGMGEINIVAGGGAYLMPFWLIDLEYSFVTGAMWAKKSVEVSEVLMAPADFVTDIGLVNNPAYAVTDIFSIRPEKSILAGIKGSEVSISKGEGIEKLAKASSPGNAGSRNVVLPLSTKKEASKLASEYLAQRCEKDSKLKLSKPRVRDLIYIPCDVVDGRVKLPGDFGALVPARVKNTAGSTLLYI